MVSIKERLLAVYTRLRPVFISSGPTKRHPMQPSITAVLVDDERLARHALRTLLAEHPNVTVTGEAESVSEAAALIPRLKPDVVFLDIQMPGESGFDLLSSLEVTFQVVFVTAYDAFAIRAFEVNALDYLLKPVEAERLAETMARVRGTARPTAPAAPKFGDRDVIQIASGQQRHFIKIADIRVIQAERDYSHVTTRDNRRVLARKTMTEWEETLGHLRFRRIHRSVIINLAFVERIDRNSEGDGSVRLTGEPEPFPISRRAWTELKELLKG